LSLHSLSRADMFFSSRIYGRRWKRFLSGNVCHFLQRTCHSEP
jgi:hypothetical protein